MILALFSSAALALVAGPLDSKGCVHPRTQEAIVTVKGTWNYQVFPSLANFNSVMEGDEPEPTFILKLSRKICFSDGGNFADGSELFDTVHVVPSPTLAASALVGRLVIVKGKAVAAHTGHHHAPLVIFAESIAPEN